MAPVFCGFSYNGRVFALCEVLPTKVEDGRRGEHVHETLYCMGRAPTWESSQWVISRDCDTEDYGGGVEPVKQVLTDNGQEFCNGIMKNWYMQKGIVHTKVGPRCIPIKSCGADASNAHWYG